MVALAVLGLVGCAIALMALAFDWRETERDYRDLHWYERTSSGKAGWRVSETVPADFGTQWTTVSTTKEPKA